MNQKKAGVLLSYGQIIIIVLSNLLYTPVMLRILGQSEYGVYSLSSSIVGYFALLYIGMTSAYLRYYSSYTVKKDIDGIARLNGLFLLLFSGLGILVLALGIAMSFNVEFILGSGLTKTEFALAHILFFIMSFNMAMLMLKTVFATLVVAQERFIFIKSLGIFTAALNPIGSIFLLYYGYGSVGMGIVVLAMTFFDLLVNIWYCCFRLKCRFDFTAVPFYLLPGMFSFSIFIMLKGIVDQFNWQMGKILLSYVADSTAIAIYSVGLQIHMLFMTMSSAFYGVAVPEIYRLVQEHKTEEIINSWVKIGRYQFYVLFFIWSVFVAFGRSFIYLWVGHSYDDAYWVVVILMTPILLPLCQALGGEIIRAYNKHAQWVIVNFFFAVAGFIVCIPFAEIYGAVGVAVGTCINTFLVTNIYGNWYYYKVGKLDVFRFFLNFRSLCPAAITIFVCSNVFNYFADICTWKSFFLVIICFTVLYCVVMYCIGMNTNEKIQLKFILYGLYSRLGFGDGRYERK